MQLNVSNSRTVLPTPFNKDNNLVVLFVFVHLCRVMIDACLMSPQNVIVLMLLAVVGLSYEHVVVDTLC